MPRNDFINAINNLYERKYDPFKLLKESLGPKGHLKQNILEPKEEYDAEAIQDNEIPEGMDEDFVTAMLIGAMLKPDRLNKKLSNSSNAGMDYVAFNQMYLLSNIAAGKINGETEFVPVLADARREVKAALQAYKNGDYGPAKEMLDRLIDYSDREISTIKIIDQTYISDSLADAVYSPERTLALLVGKVRDKEPVNAKGSAKKINLVKQNIFNKAYDAVGVSNTLRLQMINEAENLTKNDKENLAFDLLFNIHVSTYPTLSYNMRDNENHRMSSEILKKYGIIPNGAENDIIMNLNLSYAPSFAARGDMERIHNLYKIDKIEGLLAEDNGIERLREIYRPLIVNSDAYKSIVNAGSSEEMYEAVKNAGGHIIDEARAGRPIYKNVDLPDEAAKYNKTTSDEYRNSMEKCLEEYEKAIVSYCSESPDYSKYKITALDDNGLRTNAKNIENVYKEIYNSEPFSWFSDGDEKYAEIKDALKELSAFAKEMGNPAKQLSARTISRYITLARKVEDLAGKYLEAWDGKAVNDKIEAVTLAKRAVSVNRLSAEKMQEAQVIKEAEQLGGKTAIERRNKKQELSISGANRTFRGSLYRNTYIPDGAAGFKFGRMSGISIATLALCLTDKYTFDDLIDNDKLVFEKQRMFDEIVRRGRNKTPENQRWFAETIYKGLQKFRDMIDQKSLEIDYNNPDFENTEAYMKLEWASSLHHDAWQEMKRCQEEITQLAAQDNPDYANYDNLKMFLGKGLGISFRSQDDYFSKSLVGYLKGSQGGTIGNLIGLAFDYYKVKELVVDHFKAHAGQTRSQQQDDDIEYLTKMIAPVAMSSGVSAINDIAGSNPAIEKLILPMVIDGSLFKDIKTIIHKEERELEYDGLTELTELFKTNNAQYIKEKLEDKSYLKRNSLDKKLADTREARYRLFKKAGADGYHSVLNMNPEQIAEAARLFDETFGINVNKAGVKDFIASKEGRCIADVFFVNGMSLRDYMGAWMVENYFQAGNMDFVKATIVKCATDPGVELGYIDIERNPETGKYEQDLKYVLDMPDKELITAQLPHLASLEVYKAYRTVLNDAEDTHFFTDEYWNQLYMRELTEAAGKGLVSADRIVTVDQLNENTNPMVPGEAVVKHIEALYGPKKMFIKEWAGNDKAGKQKIHKDIFLSQMKDINIENLENIESGSFAILAFFVAMDADVFKTMPVAEYTGEGIPREDFIEYNSSKWTSDFWAMGIGKPRDGMGKQYMVQINEAREATAEMLDDLRGGDAEPLSDSLVKGIRATLGNIRILDDVSSNNNAGDPAIYMHLLKSLVTVIGSNNELNNAVNEKLTPEEKKELDMLMKLKEIMDTRTTALDILNRAEKGEVVITPEQRQGYVESVAAADYYISAWKENNASLLQTEEYLAEYNRMTQIYSSPEFLLNPNLGLKADIDLGKWKKDNFKHDQRLYDGLAAENPLSVGKGYIDAITFMKDNYNARSDTYKNACDRYEAAKNAPITDKQSIDGRIDLYKERYIEMDNLTQFSRILADRLDMDRIKNIVARYNAVAVERQWNRINDVVSSKLQPFSMMNSERVTKEQRDLFYSFVFEEFEKSPVLADGIQTDIGRIKSISELTEEEKTVSPVEKKINLIMSIGVPEDTAAILRNVKKNLAESRPDVKKRLEEFEDRNEVFEKIKDKVEPIRHQVRNQNPQISEDVKRLVIGTVQKLRQHGLILGNVDAEQGAKVYAYHSLLDKKLRLKEAVESGDINRITQANVEYETERDKVRDVFNFVKQQVGDRRLVPNNVDTLRNENIPPEFSQDYVTDSVLNGIYVLAEQCEKMQISVVDYMNNPAQAVNNYIYSGIARQNFDSVSKPELTFAESLFKLYKAGEREVSSPSFQRQVVGGSVSTSIGRPFDTLCVLETDPEKMLELEKHKFNLSAKVDKDVQKEGMLLENIYMITQNESRIKADKLKIYKEGLKAAFLSGGPVKRNHIGVIYQNGRVDTTNQDTGYLNAIKAAGKYNNIIASCNANMAKLNEITASLTENNQVISADDRLILNVAKQALVEAMFDYLMEHPMDRQKAEYKNLLKAAKKASTDLGFEQLSPDGKLTPYGRYKKWQDDLKKEAGDLAKEVRTADKEFDEKLRALQKKYKDARDNQALKREIKQQIKDITDSRISELIEGFRCKDITESYLKARYDMLKAIGQNPATPLHELPPFIKESDPAQAEKDYAMINDRVLGRAWEGHLSDVNSYATWRMNHVVTVNEQGEVEVKQEKNLDVQDLSQEEWILAWKNEIRIKSADQPLPEGIVDPLQKDAASVQEENHRYMEDQIAGGLVGDADNNMVILGGVANNIRDILKDNLSRYAAIMDQDAGEGRTHEDTLVANIARVVASNVIERRGVAPMGMSQQEFQSRLAADPSFKKVLKPILQEIHREATTEINNDGHLHSVDMLFEMIDNHAIISAAAMEQKNRLPGDNNAEPGVNHIKKEIAKFKKGLEDVKVNNINNNGPNRHL